MRSLTNPLAEDYLDRLERAAASLPPNDRAELLADIRAHLADVIPPEASDAEVRNRLQELGSPEEVAAAAYADGGTPSAPPAPPAAPPPAAGYAPSMPYAPAPRGKWGPLEICAVVGLTAGFFVVPVVGPVAGLVLAWISDRWTKREKVIATVLTVIPVLVIAVGGLALFVTTSGSNGSTVDHGPVSTGTTVGGTP